MLSVCDAVCFVDKVANMFKAGKDTTTYVDDADEDIAHLRMQLGTVSRGCRVSFVWADGPTRGSRATDAQA